MALQYGYIIYTDKYRSQIAFWFLWMISLFLGKEKCTLKFIELILVRGGLFSG